MAATRTARSAAYADAGPGVARRAAPRAARSRAAFSLLEVILVIALLGVIAAIVWPNFRQFMAAAQLDESVRRFETLFAMCRAEAMNEARIYRVELRADGSLRLLRQVDPIYAGHVFLPVEEDWAGTPVLGENVWVESVLPLRDGPQPLEFDETEDDFVAIEDYLPELEDAELLRVEEFDGDYRIDFSPEGGAPSLRFTLRDAAGRGIRLTYDGRIGRMQPEPATPIPADELQRPEAVEFEEDEYAGMSEQEVLAEFLP